MFCKSKRFIGIAAYRKASRTTPAGVTPRQLLISAQPTHARPSALVKAFIVLKLMHSRNYTLHMLKD
jgi:hypothetical protein